jgi:hypothetical protein
MATSKLERYNEALGALEERKLGSLSENREPRRVLDDYWSGVVAFCLEQGYWNFAMRAVQADASASISPTFGFDYAFNKPDDWIKTYEISANENFIPPLIDRDYVDEPNLWYANCDPLFVKYVSNATAYGLDLSIWSASFADYVSLRLAAKACKRITGKDDMLTGPDGLLRREKRARGIALANDAMNEGVKFAPEGTWVQSRRGGSSGRSRWDGTTR